MALQGSAVRIRLAPLVGEPSKSVTKKAFGNSEQFLKVFYAVSGHKSSGYQGLFVFPCPKSLFMSWMTITSEVGYGGAF
jgi:hypothetical protein